MPPRIGHNPVVTEQEQGDIGQCETVDVNLDRVKPIVEEYFGGNKRDSPANDSDSGSHMIQQEIAFRRKTL